MEVAGLLLLASFAAAPVPAAPGAVTGRELLADCRAAPDGAGDGVCSGWATWMSMNPRFCPPVPLEPRDVVQTLIAWLESHPGKLHMPGGALAQEAMYARFPCGS